MGGNVDQLRQRQDMRATADADPPAFSAVQVRYRFESSSRADPTSCRASSKAARTRAPERCCMWRAVEQTVERPFRLGGWCGLS